MYAEKSSYDPDYYSLAEQVKQWGNELGFQQIGITDTDLAQDEQYLLKWLEKDMHGDMDYMQRHGSKRSRPADLIPGTIRIISAKLHYMTKQDQPLQNVLHDAKKAYVSRYATGRDYHKIMRKRLQKLATKISEVSGQFGYRVFADSAPVLEKAIAKKAGLGWIGKHSNLIHPQSGSWFFLGEIYTDLPLPVDQPFVTDHCGSCTACIDACPTQAIIAPYQIDARRCISYLTIEARQSIPESLRAGIGNRVYGCDDCQMVCPWNKFTPYSQEEAFQVRNHLDSTTLLELFAWSQTDFLRKTTGSAIRRIGYIAWLRNIAVALGNLLHKMKSGTQDQQAVVRALQAKLDFPSAIVQEHVVWALRQSAS